MKLQVLAGAVALSLGSMVLAPVAAQADDGRGGYRSGSSRAYADSRYSKSYRSGGSYRHASRHGGARYAYGRSYRPYPAYRSYRPYARPYAPHYARGYYAPYAYPAPVVVPAYGYAYPYGGYGYRGYRPLSVSVQVGGPHFGVWLGF